MSSYTILATPRLSRARRFRRRKSASSPKARPNREAEPNAFLALLRMVSPAVTPMVASPSVRKITRGTRRDERWLEEEDDEGLMSWAAESRAALILVPDTKKGGTLDGRQQTKNKGPGVKNAMIDSHPSAIILFTKSLASRTFCRVALTVRPFFQV